MWPQQKQPLFRDNKQCVGFICMATLKWRPCLCSNGPEQKGIDVPLYFRVHRMWQPANWLEGRSCVCLCMLSRTRVCVCLHFWCMLCSLTQTLRWADRSVTQQKCHVRLKPASSAERAHTENGETEKGKVQNRPSSLQKCPLHSCFFLSFTYSGVMNNRGVLVLSPSPS